VSVGIGCPFSLDTAAGCLNQLQVERARKTTDDFVLRSRQVGVVGVETVRS